MGNYEIATHQQMQQTVYSFFGIQGPWYTVGWKMSVLIEKSYGRSKLIECFCDQRKLFSTYNQAVRNTIAARVSPSHYGPTHLRTVFDEDSKTIARSFSFRDAQQGYPDRKSTRLNSSHRT